MGYRFDTDVTDRGPWTPLVFLGISHIVDLIASLSQVHGQNPPGAHPFLRRLALPYRPCQSQYWLLLMRGHLTKRPTPMPAFSDHLLTRSTRWSPDPTHTCVTIKLRRLIV